MVTRFESTRWAHTMEDARVLVTLSNEASAELKGRQDWDGGLEKDVMRWRLALTPPAGVEWAQSHYDEASCSADGGVCILLGPRRYLAMVATAWILLWSGGRLASSGIETETAVALMGLRAS